MKNEALERLDEKSTFKLLKYKDVLRNLQLVEMKNTLQKIDNLVSNRTEALGAKGLVGKYFRYYWQNPSYPVFLRFDSFEPHDGSLVGDSIYTTKSGNLVRQSGRKTWIVNRYAPKDEWQIFNGSGSLGLTEITEAEWNQALQNSVAFKKNYGRRE